jgi:uncharacterized phage protein gp47/JayE
VISGVKSVTSGDLFEASFTSIPVNTEATILSAKSLGDAELKAGARNSKADAANLQKIHDLASANGAMCSGTSSKAIAHLPLGLKSIVGSVVTLTGTPTEVDIHEVIAPDADASTEPDEPTMLSLTAPAAGKAPAAQAAGADPAADEADQAKARLRLLTAPAAL